MRGILTQFHVHGQDGDLDGGNGHVVSHLDGQRGFQQVHHVVQRQGVHGEPRVVVARPQDLGEEADAGQLRINRLSVATLDSRLGQHVEDKGWGCRTEARHMTQSS
jgi:hypothetical protein